jgi:myo-inositol-1(or 4)-monophosphatase
MGAASLDLCWLAAGRTDGYWEFNLKPWDVAAGKLIVEEAGGRVTDFSGRPWKTGAGMGAQTLATNGRTHAAMLRVIRRRLAGGAK